MKVLPRGLRVRTTLSFATLALLLSVTLSTVTYETSRWYLLDQRETLGTRQAMGNALVAKELIASNPAADNLMTSLGSVTNARAVLRIDGEWHSAVVDIDESRIPQSLIETVDRSGPARQRVVVNGLPYLVVGAPLSGLNTAYFEFLSLTEYRRTLETLATALIIAAAITTIGGAFAGFLASRRLMRPLAEVAVVAKAMSAGDLARRLDVGRDRDLEPVASSFNEMATSLQQRIEREMQFTADVSHELRTPLTAMTSAVGLAKRAELPERAKFAVDVIGDQVDHMRRLTLELLEIARIDAGVAELRVEDVDVVEVSRQILTAAGVPIERFRSDLGDSTVFLLDRIRFERVIANLVENADRYAGGATSMTISRSTSELTVVVDDAGPGVPVEERAAIFGRFHRGSAEQPQDRPKGTGLGLSMVQEHVRLHGGSVYVTDSPDHGARFVVQIPVLS
ncbi:MAG: HAMP domain-containing sensor histidine kinase [Ilumatobacteraceae bacterium]